MMLGTIEGFIFTGDAHAFSAERKVDGGAGSATEIEDRKEGKPEEVRGDGVVGPGAFSETEDAKRLWTAPLGPVVNPLEHVRKKLDEMAVALMPTATSHTTAWIFQPSI